MILFRRTVIVTIGLMIVSFGFYGAVRLLDNYSDDRTQFSEKVTVLTAASDEAHSNQQISPALRREFSLLRQEIGTLRNQVKDFKSASALKEQANSGINDPNRADLEPDSHLIDNGNEGEPDWPGEIERTYETAKKVLDQRSMTFDTSFQAESTDTAWSSEAIENIHQAFLSEDLATGAELLDAQCRSAMCKIEVEHNGQEGLSHFQLWFQMMVGESLDRMAVTRKEEQSGVIFTEIFLARKGTRFPDFEPEQ